MRKFLCLILSLTILLSACSSSKDFEAKMDDYYTATIKYTDKDIVVEQTVEKLRGTYISNIEYGSSNNKLELKEDGFFYYADNNTAIANDVNAKLLVNSPEELETQISDYLSKTNNDGVYQKDGVSVEVKDTTLLISDGKFTITVKVGDKDEDK